jgi:hypothetical protein
LQINPTEVFALDNFFSVVVVFKTRMHPWIQAKQKTFESELLVLDGIALAHIPSDIYQLRV